ncbi:MAG: polysaccharide biosynthesis tyrosine autokinase [Tannerellaceae bacterium]|jgi:capsular exopolysaccharide synthesis family protein|nr:polysaccharide biosynthesis tyrosine autokinase [Tannerellaceae bacterium]
MATVQKNLSKQTEDFMQIQDLFYLCLSKWHWFVISLFVTLGIATLYVLTTPPIYTRTASILIKEDAKGKSTSSDIGSFADFGIFQTATNVNNELGILLSPDIMREVVARLHLEMDYHTDGRFYKQMVYGETLPVTVSIRDLPESEPAAFTLELSEDGNIELSDFERNGESISADAIKGKLQDAIKSPVGRIVVMPSANYNSHSTTTLYVSRSNLHNAVSKCTFNLTVEQNDEKSNIIFLSYKDASIKRAEDVLNTLISVYNENWVKDKNQIAIKTSMFINDRLGMIEGELGHVDDDISSYKSEHLLPDVQAASTMYMAQANEANVQIMALNNQVYMARYIRNYLTSETNKFQLLPANSGIDNTGIASQINEYNDRLLLRNSLMANSSTQNPLVVDMDATLVAMRKAIVSSIDNQLVTLNAQIKSLQSHSGQATSQIASNPKQAKYLLSVERQQKVKEALYLFLLQKREENELSQAFTAYNTRVITMPNGSMLPTAPVKKNILLVAFVLGLLIPIVVIFMKENMNTTVRGRKDLEGVTLPVIGEIPLYIHKEKRLGFGRKQPYAIVVEEGNRNIINEAFRVLRTNLDFIISKDHKLNVIALTSFDPGSGKTFSTMNIAVSFAIKGKKVLVIDGDLRHGSASTYVNSPRKGLSDYLGNRISDRNEIIVIDKKYENLHVLPIGTVPPNPTELLEDRKLGELINDLRNKYDYIFIDCPPVDIVADTQIIEKLADRTIFIVRAGLLKRSMLLELENIYTNKKYKNMSLMLNGTTGSGGRYDYRYGYKYGYHYGYGHV